MNKPVRFGILGCARIARRGVIRGIQTAPAAQLQAIASRQPATARAWADEFHIPTAYGSYEALLADRDVDAIYIPLPNELHRHWTLRAAEAGKHVLCEKPLALDTDDAQAMVDGCRRYGVLLMEAFMWRHHPRIGQVRQMLAAGELGELRLVKMDFSFQIDPADWRLDPARGGGALYDLGCYGINAARLFAGGEPESIHARAHLHSSGVDMTLAMQLDFAGDITALLDCSFECPYRNRLELVGTRAAVELPGGVQPSAAPQIIVRKGAELEERSVPEGDQYREQVEIFCRSIATGRLIEPAEDGLANMRVLDAVRRLAWKR
ncbi:MAG TPA: Gfo/Idh/MocA family oxidoreductase [Pirellulales bacterium]|jgi:predicted dehydrogenase|nr:Gfo/Idh/MocA family oxidoreductase [Pirellulales bacterium]